MKRPDGRATIVVGLVLVFLVLPALYVLSIGPASYLFKAGWISEGTVTLVYWPLVRLSQESVVLAEWFEWYENMWQA